ncbi:hypothetical protein BU16DRAFT_391586 [Lophium mytilinum]|uniref:Uncharacterized protein n=1 Tax=Lophium mytilinum TaxID=390894 RepID=A0A6A6QTQ6_9PEZI|nr:hypothetical protein BU16DRAFT_391586 [Lophium mytilinum]
MSTSPPSMRESSATRDIRARLRSLKHNKWGFIIYRCTYTSDSAWNLLMERLHEGAREALEESDSLDLLAMLDLTVRDDQSRFDGATKDEVRKHFLEWTKSKDAAAEQPDDAVKAFLNDPAGGMNGLTARYQFPIYVDEDAMRSVSEALPPWRWKDGYVVMIHSSWEMLDPETFNYEEEGLVRGEDDPSDEGEESIEGCKLEDVGWMKANVSDLVPDKYSLLKDPGNWESWYVRPPGVWHS